jgi:putative membrane protein
MKRLKLLSTVVIALITVLAFQSCDDDDMDNIRIDNQTFVTKASSSNNFEIAAGVLAMSKGESELVRNYGDNMVEAHTAVGLELSALADSKDWTLATELQADEKVKIATLTALTGTAFDKEYANIMVDSHEDAVDLFTSASGSNGVMDTELKSFASTKLPALKGHLEAAQTLKTEVNN